MKYPRHQPRPDEVDKDFERTLKLLERGLTAFPVPFPDEADKDKPFDAKEADREELEKFGLPPRPDGDLQPELRRAWDRGFGKPLILRRFIFDERLVRRNRFRLVRQEMMRAVAATSRFETSTNWSGAYITSNRFKKFVLILAEWKVPEQLQKPLAGKTRERAGLPYVCSNWIGLDGQRRYFNASLPQMGTASTLVDSASTNPPAMAWIQWWASSGGDIGPMPINFAVKPGDEVFCVLRAAGPKEVRGVIVNLSTPTPIGMAIKASPVVPGGSNISPHVTGATAEWILERPRHYSVNMPNDPRPDNFPNYNETKFDHCLAVESDDFSTASLLSGRTQNLLGSRPIRMFDKFDDPSRTQFISMPRVIGDRRLRVQFGSF